MDMEIVRDGIKAIIVVGGCIGVVLYLLWASFGRS